MPSRNKQPRKWSTYPALHDDVSRLLEDDDLHYDFYGNAHHRRCTQEYDTNIMGRFICRNNKCKAGGWTSKKIAITIRMYPGLRYDATVYHQRCRECNSLSKPFLDDSYADRVAYRLKKWSGIEVERPDYSGTSNAPHREDLCEGCADGHCSQLRK